ncbi:hypothetical protein VM98_35200, partial [Streptomyces rubellomurinus subsp. indigoferus]
MNPTGPGRQAPAPGTGAGGRGAVGAVSDSPRYGPRIRAGAGVIVSSFCAGMTHSSAATPATTPAGWAPTPHGRAVLW